MRCPKEPDASTPTALLAKPLRALWIDVVTTCEVGSEKGYLFGAVGVLVDRDRRAIGKITNAGKEDGFGRNHRLGTGRFVEAEEGSEAGIFGAKRLVLMGN